MRKAFEVVAALALFAAAATGLHVLQDYTNAQVADVYNFGGDRSEMETVFVDVGQGHGSGFYLGDKRVITAGHVATATTGGKVDITFRGFKPVKGTVQWYDALADVALITIDALPVDPQGAILVPPHADLACDAPDAAVGDELEAIGDPLDFINVHTYGHVATEINDRPQEGGGTQKSFLADITIAPGNSGGPVFTRSGKVAGITVAVPVFPIFGMPQVARLAYVIPKSVICQELAVQHPAPTFETIATKHTRHHS